MHRQKYLTRYVMRSFLFSAALLVSIGSWTGVASAQSGWKAEWDRLAAAAKKEGVVAVGGPRSRSARVNLLKQWKRDFPGIKMQYTVAGGLAWPKRVKAERSNGKFLWDIYLNGPNVAVFKFSQDNIFDPLVPVLIIPELKEPGTWRRTWDNMFLDSRKRMLGFLSTPSTVWYNAKNVSPAKVKKLGLRILFDPAYKGRIIWQDPRIGGPGINYAVAFYKRFGKEGLRKIIVDQESVFYNRSGAATAAFFRNKGDFVISPRISVIKEHLKAGVEVDVRPFGADAKSAHLSHNGSFLAIFNRAPHPNAAKLFANWMLTKKVQDGFSKATLWNSNRKDVAPTTAAGLDFIPGQKYIRTHVEANQATKRMVQKLTRKFRPN